MPMCTIDRVRCTRPTGPVDQKALNLSGMGGHLDYRVCDPDRARALALPTRRLRRTGTRASVILQIAFTSATSRLSVRRAHVICSTVRASRTNCLVTQLDESRTAHRIRYRMPHGIARSCCAVKIQAAASLGKRRSCSRRPLPRRRSRAHRD